MFHRDVTGFQADTSGEGEQTALFWSSIRTARWDPWCPAATESTERRMQKGGWEKEQRATQSLKSLCKPAKAILKKWCKISMEQHPSWISVPESLPRTSEILPELMYFSLVSLSRAVSSLHVISDIFTFSLLCFNDGKCLVFLPLFSQCSFHLWLIACAQKGG